MARYRTLPEALWPTVVLSGTVMGTPASGVVQTDETGYYEIRLADAPLAGVWSIQLLTDDWRPASKLFTFETDENTDTGIQQIQVIWKQVP